MIRDASESHALVSSSRACLYFVESSHGGTPREDRWRRANVQHVTYACKFLALIQPTSRSIEFERQLTEGILSFRTDSVKLLLGDVP